MTHKEHEILHERMPVHVHQHDREHDISDYSEDGQAGVEG